MISSLAGASALVLTVPGGVGGAAASRVVVAAAAFRGSRAGEGDDQAGVGQMNNSAASLAAYVPLLALVATAAVTDLRARRIPNWLTLTVAVAGLAQSLTPIGVTTFSQSLFGLLAGFTATFLLYILGGRGAGDVKLTAGIGAWLGPKAVLIVLLAAAVVSLVMVLVQCLAKGKLLQLLANTRLMLTNVMNVQRLGARHVIETGQAVRSVDRPLPNAVSMLIATAAVVGWMAAGAGASVAHRMWVF